MSAPVGHDSTHAPQDTHSDSMNGWSWLADTFDSKPRPWIVSANVPCTSSHARTQREHTMQSSGLKPKYGLLVSWFASASAGDSGQCVAPCAYELVVMPTAAAMSCSSQC